MHEWVETLRQKLREMKILSPKENLYSKLPEIRAPLLPTRDPTSPLPAPPPVPAALVPGIERIQTTTVANHQSPSTSTTTTRNIQSSDQIETISTSTSSSSSSSSTTTQNIPIISSIPSMPPSNIPTTAMSNTLTQNLINMLSNPVSTYSHQVTNNTSDSASLDDSFFFEDPEDDEPMASGSGTQQVHNDLSKCTKKCDNLSSLAKIFADNVLADPNTCPSALSSTMHRESSVETTSSSSGHDIGMVNRTFVFRIEYNNFFYFFFFF